MRRSTKTIVSAALAAAVLSCVGATPAACFRHTFEPCPVTSSADYVVEVDRKTGRTWIKARQAKVEEMAELAATAAKRLAARPVAAASNNDWRTRIDAAAGTPRQN